MDKVIFRGKISADVAMNVRLISELQQKNLSEVLNEALFDWLQRPENQKLAEKHNLPSVEA
jgi:hypothetical protein